MKILNKYIYYDTVVNANSVKSVIQNTGTKIK